MQRVRWPIILLCLFSTACSRASLYKGDGVLVDHGWFNYSRRYELDLGPIDLHTPKEHTFQLIALPTAEYVIGLKISGLSSTPGEAPHAIATANVTIELIDQSGALVMRHTAPLNDWIWSGGLGATDAFLYLRNDTGGTYFTSKSGQYALSIRVISPDKFFRYPVRVTIYGW
jgi:hypothetical protein